MQVHRKEDMGNHDITTYMFLAYPFSTNNTKSNPFSTNRPRISQKEHSPDIPTPQYPNSFTTAIAPHPAARTCDSSVVAIISEIASL